MSDLLFLNLLRTSLIVGALTLILTLLSPFWDRRFSDVYKRQQCRRICFGSIKSAPSHWTVISSYRRVPTPIFSQCSRQTRQSVTGVVLINGS